MIEGADARHLSTVRRAKAGDRIKVSNGAGIVADVRLTEVRPGRVTGVVAARDSVANARPRLIVFQGLARPSRLEMAIQKLVEIGVDELVVLRAGRSVPRLASEGEDKARRRWTAIAVEAAKQSRRPRLPEIRGPVGIEEAAAAIILPAFVAHEKAAVGLLSALPAEPPDSITLLVGPEGGFDDAEVTRLQEAGARPVGLGPGILRTETAGLVGASLTLGRYGRLG